VAALLAGVGLWDQAGGPACKACQAQIAQQMQQDKAFGAALEAALPPGAAVYQLPYMAFPEVPPQFKLGPYDLMKGYLHTRQLHWSYAGMKGREGDLFYRSLAQKPMARQLEAIRTLGFSGVYVDRGGYGDNGDAVVASLVALAGPPALTRADGQVLFFRLPPGPGAPPLAGQSAQQMIAAVYGQVSTPSLLAEGVAFAAPAYPDFVADVRGLSGAEPWGRWSDASLQPNVQIELLQPLPKRSTLVLTLQPFGPNAGQEMEVRVGAQRTRVLLLAGEHTYRVPLEQSASGASRIELRPPQPVTPRALGTGADDRLLGIGLIKLSIES
jgi:phosphoglycerol transferase